MTCKVMQSLIIRTCTYYIYNLPYYCIVYITIPVYHTMALLLTCMAIFTIIEK